MPRTTNVIMTALTSVFIISSNIFYHLITSSVRNTPYIMMPTTKNEPAQTIPKNIVSNNFCFITLLPHDKLIYQLYLTYVTN